MRGNTDRSDRAILTSYMHFRVKAIHFDLLAYQQLSVPEALNQRLKFRKVKKFKRFKIDS